MAFIQPKLLNANIDTSNIASYSESPDLGNVFNTLAGFAQKAEQVKKKREVSRLNNDIIQQNQEFNAKYLQDPTVYQNEEKYVAMLEAKDSLIRQQKESIINTKFLGEDEIKSFDASINQMSGEFINKTTGKRNEIFLKDTIDETVIEVQRGQVQAVNATGTERNAIMKNTSELVSSLDQLGVGVDQQEKMISDLHLNVITGDIDKSFNEIITNDNIDNKTEAFETAFASLTDDKVLDARILAISQASPLTNNDEYRGGLKVKAKQMIEADYLAKKDNAQNKTEQWAQQVRSEMYKTEMSTREAQASAQNAYNQKITGISTNISNGNYLAAISKAEGKAVVKGDLANDPSLAEDYYNVTMDEAVRDNGYLPDMSVTEINGYKNYNKIQSAELTARTDIIGEIINRTGYNEIERDYEKENTMLHLVSEKVITQAEYSLLNKGDEESLATINMLTMGEKSLKTKNVSYIEIDPQQHPVVSAKIDELKSKDPSITSQRERQLTNSMIGLILSDQIPSYPAEQGFSSTVFRVQYQTNPEFKAEFDRQVDVFKTFNPVKIKRVRLKTKKLYEKASVTKPVTVHKTSEEKRGTLEAKTTTTTIQVGKQSKAINREDELLN